MEFSEESNQDATKVWDQIKFLKKVNGKFQLNHQVSNMLKTANMPFNVLAVAIKERTHANRKIYTLYNELRGTPKISDADMQRDVPF
jgi:hypothetical protein